MRLPSGLYTFRPRAAWFGIGVSRRNGWPRRELAFPEFDRFYPRGDPRLATHVRSALQSPAQPKASPRRRLVRLIRAKVPCSNH